MKNINYHPYEKMSPWRKVSLGSWKPTGDSSCYCFEEIIMDDILEYCTQNSVRLNSFLVKVISNTLKKQPTINSTIRWGRLYRIKDISVFFHTVLNTKEDDLSGIVIREGQTKSISELNKEMTDKIIKSKQGDNEFSKSKNTSRITPSFFTKPLLKLYSFIAYKLNFNSSIFKLNKNAFGSVMVTSIGSLGISTSFCPIAPYTNVSMVISIGKLESKPVVMNQKIEIKNTLSLGFTFDHRIMDGLQFSDFFKELNHFFTNPKNIENEQ